ncbi:MAG: thiamine-phosphate kinase [Elusimicrobiota bacterium]
MEKLSGIGEYRALREYILPVFGKRANLGDDCGWFDLGHGKVMLASTDAVVEGTHYRKQWYSPQELALKALRSAISDISAMGNHESIQCLFCMGLDARTDVAFCHAVADQLQHECRRLGAGVLGGDLVEVQGKEFISVTVLAVADRNSLMLRSMAKPGETVWLTGHVGLARAGLEVLEHGHAAARYQKLALKQKVPGVLLKEGSRLSSRGISRCAMDLSDTLARSLRWIASLSNVDIEVNLRQFPVAPLLDSWRRLTHRDLQDYLLYGAEDYQLVFTSRASRQVVLRYLPDAYPIGEVQKGRGVVRVTDLAGRAFAIKDGKDGYEAFST